MKTHVILQGSCDGKMQAYCGRKVKKRDGVFIKEYELADCKRCLASGLLRADIMWRHIRFWSP